MTTLFKWDELEILRKEAVDFFSKKQRRDDIDRFCDYMEFVFCLVYAYGWQEAEKIIGIVPFRDGLDDTTVNLKIDGKTFRERIGEDTTPDEALRIIETESHRDYNAGVFDAAVESGKPNIRKLWNTMMDGRVRETHDYLEGMTVGLEDRFYTFDGDSARYPGDFMLPQNNVNCRCIVTLQA